MGDDALVPEDYWKKASTELWQYQVLFFPFRISF
jgi:hypothetical protein